MVYQVALSRPSGLAAIAVCTQGTFLRNGPGLFEIGNTQLPHPFDGDGMICALAFDGEGRAFFKNKYVRTEGFVAEQVSMHITRVRAGTHTHTHTHMRARLQTGPYSNV